MGSLKSTFQVLTLRMTLFASIALLMLLTRQRVCLTNIPLKLPQKQIVLIGLEDRKNLRTLTSFLYKLQKKEIMLTGPEDRKNLRTLTSFLFKLQQKEITLIGPRIYEPLRVFYSNSNRKRSCLSIERIQRIYLCFGILGTAGNQSLQFADPPLLGWTSQCQ